MEEYRDNYLSYMVKMWNEGLIDQEVYTMDRSTLTAKMSSSDIVGASCVSSLNNFPEETALEYVGVYPFDGNPYPLNNGINNGGLAITDKCENPAIVLAAFDYMYTEEGGRLARLGVEGVSYELTNEGKNWKYIYNDNGLNLWQCIWTGYSNAPFRHPDFYFMGIDPEGSPKDAHYENGRYADDGVYMKNYYLLPTLKYTEEETKTLTVVSADIDDYISSWEAQVITGEIDLETGWDEFQQKLRDMGVDRLVDVYSAAYARATAK